MLCPDSQVFVNGVLLAVKLWLLHHKEDGISSIGGRGQRPVGFALTNIHSFR